MAQESIPPNLRGVIDREKAAIGVLIFAFSHGRDLGKGGLIAAVYLCFLLCMVGIVPALLGKLRGGTTKLRSSFDILMSRQGKLPRP